MPVASVAARTQYTHVGLFSQRYGSFAGKAAAVAAFIPLSIDLTDVAGLVPSIDGPTGLVPTFTVTATFTSGSIEV